MELAILLFVIFVGLPIYFVFCVFFNICRINGELNKQYNRYLITENLIQRIRSGEDVPLEDFEGLLYKNHYNDWQQSEFERNILLESRKEYMIEEYYDNEKINREYLKALAGQAYVNSIIFGSTHKRRKQMGELYFIPEEEIKKLNENDLRRYYHCLDSCRRYATI